MLQAMLYVTQDLSFVLYVVLSTGCKHRCLKEADFLDVFSRVYSNINCGTEFLQQEHVVVELEKI